MLRQIILDTETTGLEPEKGHRIIEIGCLELVDRMLTGNHFHVYLNPEREIERGAEQVHGITQTFLQDKPKFAEVAAELLQFISGAELIIHNAPFDVGFIDSELQRLGKRYRHLTHYCTVIDTLKMARQKHPGQQNSLDALCKRYYVNNTNRQLHGALLDAELLAQVYLLMTGGQTQLFAAQEFNEQATVTPTTTATSPNPQVQLLVQPANEEELAAHERFMSMLATSKS